MLTAVTVESPSWVLQSIWGIGYNSMLPDLNPETIRFDDCSTSAPTNPALWGNDQTSCHGPPNPARGCSLLVAERLPSGSWEARTSRVVHVERSVRARDVRSSGTSQIRSLSSIITVTHSIQLPAAPASSLTPVNWQWTCSPLQPVALGPRPPPEPPGRVPKARIPTDCSQMGNRPPLMLRPPANGDR